MVGSELDREVTTSLQELRQALNKARSAIARDPQTATQAQRDQLAANLRMLAGLEERAAEASEASGADISEYLARAPDQPEEQQEEDDEAGELTDDDDMFAQFVQAYHESPTSTPSKPQRPAVALPAPLLVSLDEQRTDAADTAGSNFRPVSPKSPGSEGGGGFVRAISLQGVPVSPLPSRLSPKEAVLPTGAVAAVTARLPGLRGQSDWIGIRLPDNAQGWAQLEDEKGVRKLAECDGPATFVSGGTGVQVESVGSLAVGAMYPLGVAPPAPASPGLGQQLQHQMEGEGESEGATSKYANEDIGPRPAIAEHAVLETEVASSEAELERQRETDAHLSKAANAAAAATGQKESKSPDSSLLVVGGTGRLGQAVINRVLDQQRYGRVRVLVRPGSNAAEGGLQAAFPQADQIMASYTGQFVEGIEADVCSMSDDEVDKILKGCKGVLVCATGRDAFFPAGDSEAETMQPEENEHQLARVASLTALARGCGRRGPCCPLVLVSVATCAEVSVHRNALVRKRAEEEQLRSCSTQMPDLRYTIVRAGLLLPRPKSGTCPAFVQGMRAGLKGVISRQTLAEVVLAACEAPNALAGTTFTAVEIAAAPDSPPSAKECFARAVLVADKDAPPVDEPDTNMQEQEQEQEQERTSRDSDSTNDDTGRDDSLAKAGMRRRNVSKPSTRDDSDEDTASDEDDQKEDKTGDGNSETSKNVQAKTDAQREEEERARRKQKDAEESSGSGCRCILWIACSICAVLITILVAASRPELADTRDIIRKVHPSFDAMVDQTEAVSKWAAGRLEFHLKHL